MAGCIQDGEVPLLRLKVGPANLDGLAFVTLCKKKCTVNIRSNGEEKSRPFVYIICLLHTLSAPFWSLLN